MLLLRDGMVWASSLVQGDSPGITPLSTLEVVLLDLPYSTYIEHVLASSSWRRTMESSNLKHIVSTPLTCPDAPTALTSVKLPVSMQARRLVGILGCSNPVRQSCPRSGWSAASRHSVSMGKSVVVETTTSLAHIRTSIAIFFPVSLTRGQICSFWQWSI